MSGGARRGRGGWLMLLPVAVFGGCADVGLPGRNTPAEEAASRVWSYDVYDDGVKPAGTAEAMVHYPAPPVAGSAAAAQPAEMGRHYLPSGESMRIPQTLLRPVAGMGGGTLYALATDSPPYDRLFAPAAERPIRQGAAQSFYIMQRVPERGMAHGAETEHDAMDHDTGH